MSMPTTVGYLLITTYLTYTTESKLNEFIKKTGPNNQDIWESTSDFIPVQSKSFGTIRLGAIMSMEFDFIFWGRTNNPRPGYFEMFFRVGFNASIGTSCNGEGSRFPSFWLTGSSDTMHVSVSESSSCQPYHSLNEYGTIIINTTYHVKIEFNNTELFVSVTGGGKPDWNKTWSRLPPVGWDTFIGQIVPVWWMSDKYSGAPFNIGNGTFRNVTLISNIFTLEPTAAPTYNPTVTPTKFPSVSPTKNPSKLPSVSPTNNPTSTTQSPTHNPTKSPTKLPTNNPTNIPSILTLSPSFNPSNKPTRSPLKFCKQFNTHSGFFADNYQCKYCVCNGIDAEHCGDFAEGRSAITDSMAEDFMKYCGFDSECSFDDIAFRSSAKIKECGCQMFECDPIANYANTYTFVSAITVALLSQLIILFM